jgi:hypothetical protein
MDLKRFLVLVTLNAALFCFPSRSFAQDEGAGSGGSGEQNFVLRLFPERQAERRQSRWTLGTWLKQKRQIEQQNQWLWAHTNKIPLEWSLGYTQSPSRYRLDADAFVARLGLRVSYGRRLGLVKDTNDLAEGPNDDTSQVAAQLRLFGGNLQDSYLIARVGFEYAGLKGASGLDGGFGSWFVEPEIQVYLAQWLGLRGNLRQRWAGAHLSRKDQTWDGRNYESVAFIEMGALRVEGGYRWLHWRVDDAGDYKVPELVGAVKIFF